MSVDFIEAYHTSLKNAYMLKNDKKGELRQRHDHFISFAKYLAFEDLYIILEGIYT